MSFKRTLKQVWHFIWEEDSIWSWIANIVLAFVLIKFVIYPGLGFLMGTSYPIVAVVSSSMEHRTVKNCNSDYLLSFCPDAQPTICGNMIATQRFNLDEYWALCGDWYLRNTNITREEFQDFPFKNGFNKGDIMILLGRNPEKIDVGDVIVFRGQRPDPIIHRVVNKWQEDGEYYFSTKGDNNAGMHNNLYLNEQKISEERILGKAFIRVPLLGYIKIVAFGLLQYVVSVI